MQKPATIAILVVLVVGLLFVGVQLPKKMKYDDLRDEVEWPILTAAPIDDEAETFLKSVRDSWALQAEESPCSISAEVAKVTGTENSVEGLVSLHTYEMPKYTFFDRHRNARESIKATAVAIAVPGAVADQIYVRDGLAFIQMNSWLVEVYEDIEGGVKRSQYVNKERGKRGKGGESSSAE